MARRRVQALSSHRSLSVEALEPRLLLAGDTYLINFQPAAAPVPTRYLADTGAMFGDRGDGLFYGWSSDHAGVARDRGLQADQRLDTLIHFHQNQTWEFALPDGLYEVTVAIGDAQFSSTHTLNVEGVNYWSGLPLAPNDFRQATQQIMVTDGRLTLDQSAAAEMATRIDFIHIVGLPTSPNTPPATPAVNEPAVDGQIVNPSDVHMEAAPYIDADGDAHKSTDWEIWSTGTNAEPVWQTLGITGVERLHTHLGDGVFINSHAGRTDLIAQTVPNFDFNSYTIVLPGVTAGDHLTVVAEMIDAVGGSGSFISGMVDAFSLFSPTSVNLIDDGSFELATPGTQTTNSNWVMTTQHDGVEPSAQFQQDTWAASSGTKGVWFKGFRGTPGSPVDASVTQVVTATTSGDYTLKFDAKVEENFASVIGGFRVTITSDGTGGSKTIDLLNSLSPEYELRVRFRDDTGEVSDYATRTFVVDAASTVFPLELLDVRSAPSPLWLNDTNDNVVLPTSTPNQHQLRLESADGQLLLSIAGGGTPHVVTNPASLADHAELRVVVQAGTNALTLDESTLVFQDDSGQEHTVYLPAINLAPAGRLDLWVSTEGSTYYGTAAQTEPDFSDLARRAELAVPFLPMKPGFVVEEVAGGFQLPTNIAFVPEPGPNPEDPLFYVTELYGTIKVVSNDNTVNTYATNLLNFNPTSSFPGSGEQGLTGIVANIEDIDPTAGVDMRVVLYATRVWDTDPGNGSAEPHHPQVIRFVSAPDGLAAAGPPTVLLNMIGENQGQSHQISNASIGPDDKLYVHMGDGFDYTTAQNLNSYRGKILRMNLDGTAPSDNPFYNAGNGINARDYVYAYGFRNPFGGAWREADGKHYEVENGPSVDRFAQVNPGVNYGWNDTDASMAINAIYNWNPAHAPVNIAFIQRGTFDGSQFPAEMMDRAYVSESGATYAEGPQASGKRIVEFLLDGNGGLVTGPNSLVEYVGIGRGSVVGLAAGPDGLYFTELYKDLDAASPIEAGARVLRVRYVNPLPGDYDIDGDVDEDDFLVWRGNYGSTYLLAADGNGNRVIDGADYSVWRDALEAYNAQGAGAAVASAVDSSSQPVHEHEHLEVAPAETQEAHAAAVEEIAADNEAETDEQGAFTFAPADRTGAAHASARAHKVLERVRSAELHLQGDELLSAWLARWGDARDRHAGHGERPAESSESDQADDATSCDVDAAFDLWGTPSRRRGRD